MTPILQKLSLVAYRGIAGLTLDGLTPVSLIVGGNNAGKSSILEAAGLLLRPSDAVQWANVVRQRDTDGPFIDGLWSLFPHAGELHGDEGSVSSDNLEIHAAMANGGRLVEARCLARPVVVTDESIEMAVHLDVKVDGVPLIPVKFSASAVTVTSHDVALYRVSSVTPATHYSSYRIIEHLSRVIEEGKKQLAVEVLQVFDPAVQDLDVSVARGRDAIFVTHTTRGVVDLASFGDGMRRAAALALALTRAEQGVLLIDEIEAGIHQAMLRPVLAKLIEAARLASVQILATTHSLEAVDAILAATEGTDTLSAYWLKRKDGKHQVRRYDRERLERLRKGGLDIR